ncbi:MAG: sodium:proton antiporter [Planctomycetaceae bacterium]|nr:sodium:proton antiporter [Planctomycetaceae bacterium]
MDSPLVYLTTVLVVGVASQWLSWRLKFPALIVLLVFGFSLGRLVDTNSIIPQTLLFPAISLAVAVILFEGGLTLKIRDLVQSRSAIIRLCSFGVFLTWVPTAIAAKLIFETWEMSILVGALFVVTGPTVIIPLLRHIRPKSRIGAIAKWEGIVNDPIGAVLAVLVFETIIVAQSESAMQSVAIGFATMTLIAVSIAGVTALIIVQTLKRHLIPDYLENPVMLGFIFLTFTSSNLIQSESGLATVTLLGIFLINQKTVRIQHVVEFKENLVVLLISVLFIVLASRLSFEDLDGLGWKAVVFLAILILLIRPFSIFVSTIGTKFSWQEKTFLSVLAPRGIVAAAVASVFALEIEELSHLREVDPLLLADAQKLAPITFLVIFGTVTIYGLAAAPIARRLKISDPNPQGILFAGADAFVRSLAETISKEGYGVLLIDTNHQNISAARMLGLPTQNASIISEFVGNEVDFSGIGRLLAMTPNDEVNALAVRQFSDQFGKANLFQLTPRTADKNNPRGEVSDRLTGRKLFNPSSTYPKLTQRFSNGAIIKKTPLTEEFSYEDFQDLYGETATPLMMIDENRSLKIFTAEEESLPKNGQILISLVDHVPEQDETA